jgi:hypothetical protein
MMRNLAVLFILSAALASAQQNHDVMLERHSDHVMGFSHEKTTHSFELTRDGGVIEVRNNDIADVASRDEIQKHFRHIVRMFAAGDFSAPMLVHGRQDVPGTATMTTLKDKLHWQLEETPRGAKLIVLADNNEALAAVHDFLRFQITDHHTGDCTAVR